MEQWRSETLAAIGAARRALALALGPAAGGPAEGEVQRKAGRDVVTTADLAAEDAIRAHLEGELGIPVVGEERGGTVPEYGSYWLVDPICGTRNYASRIPLYCANLALVEDGAVTVAVACDLAGGQVWAAERGRGAWVLPRVLPGEAAGARAPRRLAAAPDSQTLVIETGRADRARLERAARCYAAAIRADRWDLRTLGTSLALPYVADARVAGYVLFSVSAVHAAAGSLRACEAGAAVSDADGEPWTIRSDSIIASAGQDLHRELVALAAGPG